MSTILISRGESAYRALPGPFASFAVKVALWRSRFPMLSIAMPPPLDLARLFVKVTCERIPFELWLINSPAPCTARLLLNAVAVMTAVDGNDESEIRYSPAASVASLLSNAQFSMMWPPLPIHIAPAQPTALLPRYVTNLCDVIRESQPPSPGTLPVKLKAPEF